MDFFPKKSSWAPPVLIYLSTFTSNKTKHDKALNFFDFIGT